MRPLLPSERRRVLWSVISGWHKNAMCSTRVYIMQCAMFIRCKSSFEMEMSRRLLLESPVVVCPLNDLIIERTHARTHARSHAHTNKHARRRHKKRKQTTVRPTCQVFNNFPHKAHHVLSAESKEPGYVTDTSQTANLWCILERVSFTAYSLNFFFFVLFFFLFVFFFLPFLLL